MKQLLRAQRGAYAAAVAVLPWLVGYPQGSLPHHTHAQRERHGCGLFHCTGCAHRLAPSLALSLLLGPFARFGPSCPSRLPPMPPRPG